MWPNSSSTLVNIFAFPQFQPFIKLHSAQQNIPDACKGVTWLSADLFILWAKPPGHKRIHPKSESTISFVCVWVADHPNHSC